MARSTLTTMFVCPCGKPLGPGVYAVYNEKEEPICSKCAESARRQRWREKNPTFKEMVEMDDARLEEALNRLFIARAERGKKGG